MNDNILKKVKYECKICGYTSRHKNSVKTHLTTAHNEQNTGKP